MRLNSFTLVACLLATLASAASAPAPDKNGKYWIHGEGISAAFIPYGASITDLVLKDKHGIERDVVVGFDNATYYETDKQHSHLGGVPGRYANRIKNSTFEIDGKQYKANSQGESSSQSERASFGETNLLSINAKKIRRLSRKDEPEFQLLDMGEMIPSQTMTSIPEVISDDECTVPTTTGTGKVNQKSNTQPGRGSHSASRIMRRRNVSQEPSRRSARLTPARE